MPLDQTLATDALVGLQQGLPAGTTVMTLDGEIPVELLAAGDRVITRTSGMAILQRIDVVEAPVSMIRVLAGSLGHTRPGRDMRLGPDTLVHIRDWRAQALYGKATAAVPARRLVDGEFVSHDGETIERLFSLHFDRPQVIYADGLEVAV
jgi:hypothetical protein